MRKRSQVLPGIKCVDIVPDRKPVSGVRVTIVPVETLSFGTLDGDWPGWRTPLHPLPLVVDRFWRLQPPIETRQARIDEVVAWIKRGGGVVQLETTRTPAVVGEVQAPVHAKGAREVVMEMAEEGDLATWTKDKKQALQEVIEQTLSKVGL